MNEEKAWEFKQKNKQNQRINRNEKKYINEHTNMYLKCSAQDVESERDKGKNEGKKQF